MVVFVISLLEEGQYFIYRFLQLEYVYTSLLRGDILGYYDLPAAVTPEYRNTSLPEILPGTSNKIPFAKYR